MRTWRISGVFFVSWIRSSPGPSRARVTSGGRSIFPQDIPVGRVIDPDQEADYARSIEIDLSASLENLSFLNVILEETENLDK